jgi:oxygen-independent coproporphyrinogen III oxidase
MSDFSVPRSAYLHVPFCRHRCGYCNFTLITGRDDLIEPLLDALELELAALGRPHEVDTIFLGGGTPTYLPIRALERLLGMVRRWLPLAAAGEWSAEANPSDLTAEVVGSLACQGVNRLSLGVQSFQQAKLRVLERDHSQAEIARAVELARPRMNSLSFDLIFAAPGESLAGWQADVTAALALEPNHLSCYGLTIEQGAAFYGRMLRGQLTPLEEETEREMYEWAIDRLSEARFEHYEVSSFARPGHRCRHNEVYWSGRPYLAFGPGAARYVEGRREMNHRSVTTYIRRMLAGESPVAHSECLPPEAAARERLVFALRRLEGISLERFHSETGYRVEQLVGGSLQRFCDHGLLQRAGDRLRLTREGLLVSDSLWSEFLLSAERD